MDYQDNDGVRAEHQAEQDAPNERRSARNATRFVRDRDTQVADFEIIRAPDNGPLRTFNGGQKHENGWFASRKGRRLLHWEGTSQLAFITRAEVDFNVVRVATESVRFRFIGEEGWQEYTADVELIGPDGKITIVEIKRDERDLADPQYKQKLVAVGQLCNRQGWDFKIVFGRDVFCSLIHRRNVTLFASRAFVTIERRHERRFEDLLEQNIRALTYGELAAVLEPGHPRWGEALVQALTVARRVEIDLTQPLFDATPLTLH